jgi:hypothetical protein
MQYLILHFIYFLPSAMLSPEKELVERAIELRAELENAASDVSNLFSKIGKCDSLAIFLWGSYRRISCPLTSDIIYLSFFQP